MDLDLVPGDPGLTSPPKARQLLGHVLADLLLDRA
jgi:hypothetical protein